MAIPEATMARLILIVADIGSDIVMDLYQRSKEEGGVITADQLFEEFGKWQSMKTVQDQKIKDRQED